MSDNDSGEIKFVDPPEVSRMGRPRLNLSPFADALKANPGRWAIYPFPTGKSPKSSNCLASLIRRHQPSAPAALREGFDATSRAGVLYVRYIGGDK